MGGGLEFYALGYGAGLAVLNLVTAADSVMRLMCFDSLLDKSW